MKKKFFKNKKKGDTLVETLVAIAIFSVSILGILSVLASSITNTNYAKNKMIAGYLAQEGIEYVRNMRDTYVLYPANGGWSGTSSFVSKLNSCVSSGAACGFDNSIAPGPSSIFTACGASPSTPCLLYFNNGNYNIVHSGSSSNFTRKIWMTNVSANEEKIFSEVDYQQGSSTASIVFSEDLFNWES
jgi:Tfp pilus assembly protein PilV